MKTDKVLGTEKQASKLIVIIKSSGVNGDAKFWATDPAGNIIIERDSIKQFCSKFEEKFPELVKEIFALNSEYLCGFPKQIDVLMVLRSLQPVLINLIVSMEKSRRHLEKSKNRAD